MTDLATIQRWADYAAREGTPAAITKLFEIVDGERANADRCHSLYREARDALWTAQYVEGDADLLKAVADEIDCGQGCDCAHQEHDTGAWFCSREDADGIGCRGSTAARLREMSQALNVRAARPVQRRTAYRGGKGTLPQALFHRMGPNPPPPHPIGNGNE